MIQGPLAQSVEQRTFNPWVVGSIPTGPTAILEDYVGLRGWLNSLHPSINRICKGQVTPDCQDWSKFVGVNTPFYMLKKQSNDCAC